MKAEDILKHCVTILASRGKERDQVKERSMGNVVKVYESLTGRKWAESEGWQFMVALKLGRIKTKYREDDVFDLINYVALWMESMSEENKDIKPVAGIIDEAIAQMSKVENVPITIIGNDDKKVFAVYNSDNHLEEINPVLLKIVSLPFENKGMIRISLSAFAEVTGQSVESIVADTHEERDLLNGDDMAEAFLSLLPTEAMETVEEWRNDINTAAAANPAFHNVMLLINSVIVGKRELLPAEIQALTEYLEASYANSACQCKGVRMAAIAALQHTVELGKVFQNPQKLGKEAFLEAATNHLCELYQALPYIAEHAKSAKVH